MKLTVLAPLLMGYFSIASASPHPNNAGTHAVPSLTATLATTSTLPAISAAPTSVQLSGSIPPILYTSTTPYGCYPISPSYSVPHAASTTWAGSHTSAFTVTLSATAVTTGAVTATSVALENWGNNAHTVSSVPPGAVTSTLAVCPPGYTTTYSGWNATTSTFLGGNSSAAPVPATITTGTSNATTSSVTNRQNLNSGGDTPSGATVFSFKLNMAGSVIGTIVAAVWMI